MHLLSAIQMKVWYSNGGLYCRSFNDQTNFHDLKTRLQGGLNTENWNIEHFEVQMVQFWNGWL